MWKHTVCGTSYCEKKIAALGKLSKDDKKPELCIVAHSIINFKSHDLDLHFYEHKAHIQKLTPIDPHSLEIAQDQDLTIPRAYY